MTGWDSVLGEAATLLRELPRHAHAVDQATERVQAWAARHPTLDVRLVPDRPPTRLDVDYDLLLTSAEGTLALSWRGDDGVPWLVEYADHWASNLVVSVNNRRITVQQALLALRVSPLARVDLLTQLVDLQLLLQAAERDGSAMADDEVQRAADLLRRELRLHSAADTRAWLESFGLSVDQFEAMATAMARTRKALARIAEERVERYFHDHIADFDRVRLLIARVRHEECAHELAGVARAVGLLRAAASRLGSDGPSCGEAVLGSRHAIELPAAFRSAGDGELVGPVQDGQDHLVGEIFGREPARLDPCTRDRIQGLVFEAWLAEERERADVVWHWMP